MKSLLMPAALALTTLLGGCYSATTSSGSAYQARSVADHHAATRRAAIEELSRSTYTHGRPPVQPRSALSPNAVPHAHGPAIPVATAISPDIAVMASAGVEPLLQLPARFGLARLENGHLTAVPEAELVEWRTISKTLGRAVGDFQAINPLAAQFAASTTPGTRRDVIETIRVAAARQHMDAVMVYELRTETRDTITPFAVTNITLLGGLITPGASITADSQAHAALIDVRNGYVYGTASSEDGSHGLAPSFLKDGARRDLAQTAKIRTVRGLVTETAKMASDLIRALPWREADRY